MIARNCKLPLSEKLDIINECETNSQLDVANHHRVSRQAISNIIKNQDKFKERSFDHKLLNSKGLRSVFPLKELEEEVNCFILKCNQKGIVVGGDLIRNYALKIAGELNLNFQGSKGWLHNFLKRSNVNSLRLCGEEGLVDAGVVNNWNEELKEILSKKSQYIWLNADETAFLYKNQANRSYIHPCGTNKNVKKKKERLTVLFCVSSTGRKFKPLIIGKSVNPRCFKNNPDLSEKIIYKSNLSAWMTSPIFTEWLKEMDEILTKENTKATIFLDNFGGHQSDFIPTNITPVYLPPNTTSLTQPLDGGIIHSIKAKYKKLLSLYLIEQIQDENTDSTIKLPDLYQALTLIIQSFDDVDEETIINCWRRCQFFN